jgi:hypothetical protein
MAQRATLGKLPLRLLSVNQGDGFRRLPDVDLGVKADAMHFFGDAELEQLEINVVMTVIEKPQTVFARIWSVEVTHLTRRGRKKCTFASMKAQPIADLYAAYLLASFGATTATGLSQRLKGEISHDQVTRYLAGTKKTAAALWRTVKLFVREVQSEEGVLSIEDSIEEKPYTDENAIVGWHYDPSKDRMLKGINFLTALYSSQGVSLPVGFHLVAKTQKDVDPKTQKENRRRPVSKHAVGQELSKQAVPNLLPLRFVLFAVWFASAQTLVFIKQQQHRDVICPLKTNRKVAWSRVEKPQGR